MLCGALAAVLGPAPAGVAASTAPEKWTTFQYDNLHSGVSPDTALSTASAAGLKQVWKRLLGGGASTDEPPVWSSPAVAYSSSLGKTLVYAASAGTVGSDVRNSVIDAIDASTGVVVWTRKLSKTSVWSSPLVSRNALYIGSSNHSMYVLDAGTGSLICSFDTGGRILDPAVVGTVDGSGPVVFFGDTGVSESDNAGHEWAMTGVGNSAGPCHLKWAFNAWADTGPNQDEGGSWSPPALATDSTGRPLLVFGSSQPDDSVYALDARTGAQVWRFMTAPSPADDVDDEDVGAGATISKPGANGFADGTVYINGKDQIEYALDLLTGAELWEYSLYADHGRATNSVSTGALVGNSLLVGFNDLLYSLNATTGAEQWSSLATGGSTVFTSVAVSGPSGSRVAAIGDDMGGESVFSVKTGALLRRFTVPGGLGIRSSAAIAGGRLFFGADDGRVYALAPP